MTDETLLSGNGEQKMNTQETDCLNEEVLFSVVVPVFNVEPYLAQCLDSVLPALHADDEVILSLGHSADNSTSIAEHYTQQYTNVQMLWQDGAGLSNARNCAVRQAHGTYIVYVDSDDHVDTELFTHALQQIRNSSVRRDMYVFDFYHDNCLTGQAEPWFQIGAGGDFYGVEHIEKMLKHRKCFWNVWRYIYRREFLEQHGISFLEGRMSEDVDYTVSVLLAQPDAAFYHTPYYFYAVRRGRSLMDSPTLGRLEDTVFVLERSIRWMLDAALPYSNCIAAQFQFEYVLDMAQIYEIPVADRAQGKLLFSNALDTLANSSDGLVRLIRFFLQFLGLATVAYALYSLKMLRRKLQNRKRRLS